MASSVIVFWLVDRSDAVERVRAELTPLVGSLSLFSDDGECIAQLAQTDASRVRLVVSESNGEQFVRRIPSREKLHSIYVLCSSRASQRHWQSLCRPVRCVLTNLASLCERIRTEDQGRDSGLVFDVLGPSATAEGPGNNRQEAVFMYGQLLKNVITQMEYTKVDKKSMFEFLREKCQDNQSNIDQINKLEARYCPEHAILYYSIYAFLYATLNDALRNCKVEEMIKLGVFIQDLHAQLTQKHQQTAQPRAEKSYRGMVIPRSIFDEKIDGKEGGLMSVKEFMSTSFDIEVAKRFTWGAPTDQVGVIFHIDLGSSRAANTVYVDISGFSQFPEEAEILFSMGSVFRIARISCGLDGVYHIDLSVTTDHDEQLTALTQYYRKLLPEKNWVSLCGFVSEMGDYQAFVQLCRVALERSTESKDKMILYYVWSLVCFQHGLMDEAKEKRDIASKEGQRLAIEGLCDLPNMLIQAQLLTMQGHSDEARTVVPQIEKLFLSVPSIASRPELRRFCPTLKAILSSTEGYTTEAAQILKQLWNEERTSLPDLHPENVVLGFRLGWASDSIDPAQSSQHRSQTGDLVDRGLMPCHPLRVITDTLNAFKSQPSPCDGRCSVAATTTAIDTASTQSLMALWAQAMSCAERKRFDDAVSTIDKAIHLMEEHSSTPTLQMIFAFAYRGRWLKKQGNLTEALKSLQTAEGMLSPSMIQTNLPIWLVFGPMAEVYLAQDNDGEALRVLERCHQWTSQSTDRDLPDIAKDRVEIISLIFTRNGARSSVRKEHHKAVRLFRSNVKVCQMFLGNDHARLAQAYRELGEGLVFAQNFAEALTSLEQALESSQKTVHCEFEDMLKLWQFLAIAYTKLQRPDDALAAHLEYLELLQRADPPDHEEISRIHQHIGVILSDLGHFTEAISHCQRALDIHIAHFPTQQAQAAKLRQTLDDITRRQQQQRKHHDAPTSSDSAETAEMHRNSGLVHAHNERFSEALHHFQRLLEIQTATLQPDDAALDDTHLNVGLVLNIQEKPVEARPYLERALRGYRQYLPETDKKIQRILTLLACQDRVIQRGRLHDEKQRAMSLTDQGKYREALAILEECLAIERALLPADAVQIAVTLYVISLQHYLLHQFADACHILEPALSTFLEHLPRTVEIAISGYLLLARIHHASGQHQSSISAAEQALEFQLNILAPDDLKVAETHRLLSVGHMGARNCQGWLEHMSHWHNIHEKVLPPDDPRVIFSKSTIDNVVHALQTQIIERRSTPN